MNQFTENWIKQTGAIARELEARGSYAFELNLSAEDKMIVVTALRNVLTLLSTGSQEKTRIEALIQKLQ